MSDSPELSIVPRPAAEQAGAPTRIRRILVPVDFSHLGEKALNYARDLACHLGAQLCLLHVVERMDFAGEYATVLLDSAKAQAEYLGHLKELQYGLLADLHTEATVREGVPFQEIVQAARDLNCDLTIMCTHGRTGLVHMLMGSTAERVVRHATGPVLVVPAQAKAH